MKKRWYLGKTKRNLYGFATRVYLEDFTWDCGWYWGGGYVGNKNFGAHFDGCFLDVPDSRGHPLGAFFDPWTRRPDTVADFVILKNGAAVWEDLNFFLDNAQYTSNEWWRIKDLFKQFYALRTAAEVFQYGGHCSSGNRRPAEINKEMAATINKHLEEVVIPAIRDALDHKA